MHCGFISLCSLYHRRWNGWCLVCLSIGQAGGQREATCIWEGFIKKLLVECKAMFVCAYCVSRLGLSPWIERMGWGVTYKQVYVCCLVWCFDRWRSVFPPARLLVVFAFRGDSFDLQNGFFLATSFLQAPISLFSSYLLREYHFLPLDFIPPVPHQVMQVSPAGLSLLTAARCQRHYPIC